MSIYSTKVKYKLVIFARTHTHMHVFCPRKCIGASGMKERKVNVFKLYSMPEGVVYRRAIWFVCIS